MNHVTSLLSEQRILFIVVLLLTLDFDLVKYDDKIIKEALHTNTGRGRGTCKIKKRESYTPVDVVAKLRSCSSRIWDQVLHFTSSEFDEILKLLTPFRLEIFLNSKTRCLNFENKVLLVLI